MATQRAIALRNRFINATENEFEALTFGELKVGDSFITFPDPGDNSGHGGFKGKHWIFIKTQENVEEAGRGLKYAKDNPHGKACNTSHGDTEDNFPLSMLVIQVE